MWKRSAGNQNRNTHCNLRSHTLRPRRNRFGRGQSSIEFALIMPVAVVALLVGVQYAIIGQAYLAVSQGASALARYAAVNPGTVGPNGTVTLTTAMKQLLSPTILDNSGANLTVTIASYTGTTTTTTSSPQYTDRLVMTLTYNATNRIALPNPFFKIAFPTSLASTDSQLYE